MDAQALAYRRIKSVPRGCDREGSTRLGQYDLLHRLEFWQAEPVYSEILLLFRQIVEHRAPR